MSDFQDLMEKHGVKYNTVMGEVGPGWFPILDRLIPRLLALGWDGDLHQVKEKFGGLRFYIGGGSKEIWEAIAQAEGESFRTCEECGAPGEPARTRGWIKTLCDGDACQGTGK